ncbi:hypothetical protein A4S05_07510 [Nostoc sp. KVJ20]|nr:hypothetical protein A4S05_07510 [Nostoc sp. KVJ20]
MPLVKLVQSLYQFLFNPIALELTFWSTVIKLVLLLIPVNLPINTITVNTNSLKSNYLIKV